MPSIDLWANFLANEKLTPARADPLILIRLCEEMAKIRGPLVRPYAAKLESRRFVCSTAIDFGIDLGGLKFHGRLAMGSGLLEAWNKECLARFGSITGTAGKKERIRRDVVNRLSK